MGSRTASRVRPLRVRWKLVLGYGHTRLRRGTGVAMLLLLIFIPTALVLRAREKANVTFDAISARLTAYGNLLRAHATAAPQFPEVHIARVTKRPIVPASGPVVTIFSPVNDRRMDHPDVSRRRDDSAGSAARENRRHRYSRR